MPSEERGKSPTGFRHALGHGGVATAGRLVGTLLLNKVIALFGGPTALATIGQVQNLITVGSSLTGAALSNGATSIATPQAVDAQQRTMREARRLSFQGGVILLPLLLLMPFLLRELLPNLGSDIALTLLLAIAIFATGQIQLALALLNAQRRLAAWSSMQVVTALLQPVAAYIGFRQGGLVVALFALLLSNIFPLFLLLLRYWNLFPSQNDQGVQRIERAVATRKRLLGFGIVQGLSLLLAPISLTWIRQLLVTTSGWEAAGHWQAIWKLSEISISLIATALTAHLLPQMAGAATPQERTALLRHTLRRVIALSALLSGGLFLFREVALTIAFDQSFSAAAPAMGWQLLGDILRMINWSLGLTLLARERLKSYAFSEVISIAILVITSGVLIPRLGVSGATIAHLIENGLILLLLAGMVKRAIR